MKSLIASFLALSIPASALTLKTGDVFDWSRQDLEAMTESPTKVTVLSKGLSDSLPADSGAAWKILVQPQGATPETLELFEFKNGAQRWTRGSKRFPVEFESPRAASRSWVRGGIYWGMPETGRFVKDYLSRGPDWKVEVRYDTTGKDGATRVVGSAESLYPHAMGLGDVDVQGRWTDSVGPLWYSEGKDWTLLRRNGVAIGWTNPRMDSVAVVLAGLHARAKALYVPRRGDAFVWSHVQSFFRIPSNGPTSGVDSTRVTLTVTDVPEDSPGWIRWSVRYVIDSASGGSRTWTEKLRRDSIGSVSLLEDETVLAPHYSVLEGLWAIHRNDKVDSAGTFKRAYYETGNGTATYLLSGVLTNASSSGSGSVQLGCTSCVNRSASSWELLAAPGWVSSTGPRSPRPSTRLDSRILHDLQASDPAATVRWADLSGATGQGTVLDFLRGPRTSGARWVEVQTTDGRKLRGVFVNPR